MTKLTLVADGDRQIVVTRSFAAPPEAVWRAHTEPSLIRRWLLGPDGWSMPVCLCDARPGGAFRYEWVNAQGAGFCIAGVFVELVPFTKIVHVERMYLPEATPENHVETRFEPAGAGTRMTVTMTLPDAQTRAAMLASGMAEGMEASYARFETTVGRDALEKSSDYSVETVAPQSTAAVKIAASFAELPAAERAARTALATALPALGFGTVGETYTLCRMLESGKMHYEPGVIVDRSFPAAGDVVASQLPGGRVVTHRLVGPFDQLPQAWPALFAWCDERGLEREGWFWQVYGPTASDPAEQVTMLYALLA